MDIITAQDELIDLETWRIMSYLGKHKIYKQKGYGDNLRFPENIDLVKSSETNVDDVPPPHVEPLKLIEVKVSDSTNELVDRVHRNNLNVVISIHWNSMNFLRKYFENLDINRRDDCRRPFGAGPY